MWSKDGSIALIGTFLSIIGNSMILAEHPYGRTLVLISIYVTSAGLIFLMVQKYRKRKSKI
ncbi:recombinational DNA repair protein (RecF pathway) [Paenibacillus sp. SORGH_AS306]|nr:recombinational DNA repair protein (RecF pathway) [Paenibacillus sp. SORGH_AS_0306]MDR6112579.1 recombinational DNA repair protein (RecF pathway) [Paenibacillus sp. SORGH_AS_0338]